MLILLEPDEFDALMKDLERKLKDMPIDEESECTTQ